MLIHVGGSVALAVSAGHVLLLLHGAAANDVLSDLTCSEVGAFICSWDTPQKTCDFRNWELAKDFCEKNHGDMDAADCCRQRDVTPQNEPGHVGYMRRCAPGCSPGAPGVSEMECSRLENFVCQVWMEGAYCHVRHGQDVGCQAEKECTSKEYPLMCCQAKSPFPETHRAYDKYMEKCHPPNPSGLASHCERMATQANWCQASFRSWVSQQELTRVTRNGDSAEWWKRMDMGHWERSATLPPRPSDAQLTEQESEDLTRQWDRAYAMTAREWRVMCARAVGEKKMCEADPQRELSLMRTPDWMRRMALALEEDVEAGKKLDDSPGQYAYGAAPAKDGGVRDWLELERAATGAWRNRLLKLEELAVYRPPKENYFTLNQIDPVWETWKSTVLNMTLGSGGVPRVQGRGR